MNIKSDTFPLVASPIDNVWAVFPNFETLAFVYVESLTPFATVEIASGPTYDPLLLGGPTTLTFTQQGVVKVTSIPIGGNGINRATRINPTSGRVAVTFVGPGPFTTFMMAPPVSTFGPL